ncbi:related to proline oxidase [Cephalotrichum gorgonifer]|uniref:Proline dehydrogenase n=1 Tax=Cephalotrichum gorgonifer TaxID=2041049 RepID=A0AAE8SVA9_9PEZI|nr:related to proline oxidase [Cephalotrichum gorgonifer]
MILGPAPPLVGTGSEGLSTGAYDVVPAPSQEIPATPLSVLPLKVILRSLFVSAVSSSKPLLPPSLYFMSILASSTNPLLNPDKNPVLRFFVKQIFYDHFCAGETREEVGKTIADLKGIGYSGVMLCYAREAVPEGASSSELLSNNDPAVRAAIDEEVKMWAEGTLRTVSLAQAGDFVALKFTGAGRESLVNLAERRAPPPAVAESIDAICSLAASRGVRLLVDAEHAAIQKGIDDWTLTYMRKWNRGRICIYSTYQAYLKSCGDTLKAHLELAREEGFSLGVKLVRGAYLASDPRHLIHDTKANTDEMYDSLAKAVLTRRWEGHLAGGQGEFPETSLVLGTHNPESVQSARAVVESGEAKTEAVFAQLMGMADEISTTLLPGQTGAPVKAYKYLVWGTTGECMKYLLRRAYENSDAVGRTRDGRDAMAREVVRRVKAAFGIGQRRIEA